MEGNNIIKSRWEAARKVSGCPRSVILQDGTTLNGRYYLVEAGSVTPSHDALQGFAPSEGFPTDAGGGSVNDRDYWRDRDAQRITMEIARNYDGRAIQSPVIVSPDGVVLSGNGRTMAGDIAAHGGTDGAYIDYLKSNITSYGLSVGDVTIFSHPRLVLVLDEPLPYTANTFARFNAQEQKTMSKTEQAIKYGKTVDDAVFGRILSVINAFETLGDFYACTEAATGCINDLRACGVIDSMSYAEMFDGDTISTAGRELLENVLIGKAFAADPDAARKITTYKSLRKSVVFGLSEVVNNLCLGDDYTIKNELSEAINLAYIGRQHGYKSGERVSAYARQMDAFSGGTVCDYKDTIILTLADALNDSQVTILKKILSVYNHQAQDAASGQTDMFCTSGVKTKAEILEDVKTIFAKGTTKEQKEAVTTAVSARMSDNIFVTSEQLSQVVAGSYVEYVCKSGDTIICKVDAIKNTIAYLSGKGGIKFWRTISELKPSASHLLSLPEWIKSGTVITDGTVSQRIAAVSDTMVVFEWLNGGYFDVQITDILQRWQVAASGVCEIIEAA